MKATIVYWSYGKHTPTAPSAFWGGIKLRQPEHQKYVEQWPFGLSLGALGLFFYLLLGSRKMVAGTICGMDFVVHFIGVSST